MTVPPAGHPRLPQAGPPLVLASASASRAALLQAAGLDFEVVPAMVDEASLKVAARAGDATAAEAALLLATAKAAAGARRAPGALVIGADQILVCDDAWFDKPASLAAARQQLGRLRGRTHALVTAVACRRDATTVWTHVATPRLHMRDFGDALLEAYLAAEGDRLLTSVGAYRLEGPGVQLFDRVEGEHAAILGLPLLALFGYLRDCGVLSR